MCERRIQGVKSVQCARRGITNLPAMQAATMQTTIQISFLTAREPTFAGWIGAEKKAGFRACVIASGAAGVCPRVPRALPPGAYPVITAGAVANCGRADLGGLRGGPKGVCQRAEQTMRIATG